MALVLLAAMSVGCAAPLNPKYREDEFRFYLDDLHAAALVTFDGGAPRPRTLRRRRSTIVERRGDGLSVDLESHRSAPAHRADVDGLPTAAAADDQALVLHTSGTTSRPKIVPLRQRNLAASARNIAASLQLTAADRSLDRDAAVPHPRDHGRAARAALGRRPVVCTPGFDAFKFHRWLDELRPTYYTRRADDAPDGAGPRAPRPRRDDDTALRPLVVGLAAGAGARRS